MRYSALALAFIGIALPTLATAQSSSPSAPVVHAGDMLRDANNFRLSSVDSVGKDGSVGIIYNGHVVTVPAASLSVVKGKLMTSLTRDQVASM